MISEHNAGRPELAPNGAPTRAWAEYQTRDDRKSPRTGHRLARGPKTRRWATGTRPTLRATHRLAAGPRTRRQTTENRPTRASTRAWGEIQTRGDRNPPHATRRSKTSQHRARIGAALMPRVTPRSPASSYDRRRRTSTRGASGIRPTIAGHRHRRAGGRPARRRDDAPGRGARRVRASGLPPRRRRAPASGPPRRLRRRPPRPDRARAAHGRRPGRRRGRRPQPRVGRGALGDALQRRGADRHHRSPQRPREAATDCASTAHARSSPTK